MQVESFRLPYPVGWWKMADENQTSWVRGKRDEIRMGAANTLAMVGTPEAKAILEAGKESKDETLRDACVQALKIRSSKEPVA